MPFYSFNGVQQTTTNSCGAFALAAALSHVRKNLTFTNELNVVGLNQGFSVPSPQALAQSIYQITGNLLLRAMVHSATYRYTSPVSDMNSPSALVYMASNYGVQVQQLRVFYNNAAEGMFRAFTVTNAGAAQSLFDTEINLITDQNYGGVVGPTDYTARPAANEAQLLLVNNADHWIALTHDQCYDSGTGVVGPYNVDAPAVVTPTPVSPLTQVNSNGKVYPFTGIWISLTAHP